MENSDDIELISSYKKLVAENASFGAMLQDYAGIIRGRDNEIAMLQTMLTEANENQSKADSQQKELAGLQFYINDLKQQVGGSVYMATGKQQQVVAGFSVEQQLDELKKDYAVLQSKLNGLQMQLQELNGRNIQLQLQVSRVAELESLLENYQHSDDKNIDER